MKIFICALVIFFILIVGTCIYMNWLEKTVTSVNKALTELSSAAKTGNWRLCKTETDKFLTHWSTLYPKLEFFINHNEIKDINRILYELSALIDAKNKNVFIFKIDVLQKMINDLPSGERLSWENVLFLAPETTKNHIVLYTG